MHTMLTMTCFVSNLLMMAVVSPTAFAFTFTQHRNHRRFEHQSFISTSTSTSTSTLNTKQRLPNYTHTMSINDDDTSTRIYANTDTNSDIHINTNTLSNSRTKQKSRIRNNRNMNKYETSKMKIQSIGNRKLNPNNILLPSYFPYYKHEHDHDHDLDSFEYKKSNNSKIHINNMESNDREITLQRAIVELTEAMASIVQFESECSDDDVMSFDAIEKLEFILGSNGASGDTNIFIDSDSASDSDYVNANINGDTNDNYDSNNIEGIDEILYANDNTNGNARRNADFISPGTKDTINNQQKSQNKFFTIRVEQPLSHSVDPLCWLHANVKKSPFPSSSSSVKDEDPAVIYLANAENTMEAAIYGSSYTIHDLNDDIKREGVVDDGNINSDVNDNDNANANGDETHDGHQNYSSWDLIQNLPMGSRVFGGGRFDKDLDSSLIGEEWKEFGKEIWILPAVELRREEKVDDQKNENSNIEPIDLENKNNGMKQENQEEGNQSSEDKKPTAMVTTISVNLHFTSPSTLIQSARNVLILLQKLSHEISPPIPITTLPPILSRRFNSNAQEVFEKGVNAALDIFQNGHNSSDNEGTKSSFSEEEEDSLQKVVLARRSDLQFGTEVSGLDLMMKLKFGGNIGGHLFYMNPGKNIDKEFLGCAPERLFQARRHDKMVLSEALAGTRPRGSTSEEDKELLRELMYSKKDQSENMITGKFIKDAFNSLQDEALLQSNTKAKDSNDVKEVFFVRRLRHLQHICQSINGVMKSQENTVDVSKSLLQKLHPTPAVCGYPGLKGLEFIRQYETSNFDRGMYAGPFGYIGRDITDIMVAIRSGLLSKSTDGSMTSKLSIYAGAGVVSGSTVQGEWSETGYKLGVLSSVFAQSPLTLKSFPTPNEAWATSFIEELIRSGVTQYYICPGSRSTPLTAALARAMRAHIGVIECISVHDERAAAFRALGYGRATSRTAAVITSSGTAVANLYPAVIESSMDGIPMLLLTADRPYENRDIGANQAIDQIKVFSETYTRWFRDIAPPSEDVPISLAISDANHAATIAQDMLGPVHLNIQFRENLAPEGGPIRGDGRPNSITTFSASRFTDVPGFQRWSIHGKKWTNSYGLEKLNDTASIDVANLIAQSKRGIIVLGNIRKTDATGGTSHSTNISAIISDFAKFTGFPVFAGAQSAAMRFESSAVIPYAEHLLRHPVIKSNSKPDLIIQIGSTLVSTEIEGLISQSMYENRRVAHVLLHTHRPSERADPSGTVTHKITSEIASFLPQVRGILEVQGFNESSLGSQLAPLVHLGRQLGKHMPSIIHDAATKVRNNKRRVWDDSTEDNIVTLAEPEIIVAMSEVMCDLSGQQRLDLFLSNSMPVRDSECFLYPTRDYMESNLQCENQCLGSVAVNRGASGIDGIISTATGFVEATSSPTTLLIGDLATLHDLNAFHHLSSRSKKPLPPLTTIIVNNDGGGIFSFLPVAKFGNDVGFEEFFGTPTNAFSFGKGAEAFGLPYENASNFDDFKSMYKRALLSTSPTMLEAKVVGREENVHIHKEITAMTINAIDEILQSQPPSAIWSKESRLPTKVYRKDDFKNKLKKDEDSIEPKRSKTLVLLHGWMSDKDEWDQVALSLMQDLSSDWSIISVDLPGHGETPPFHFWSNQTLRNMLSLDASIEDIIPIENESISKNDLSVKIMAESVLQSLSKEYGLTNIDALAGYSLGGRIALSMKRLCTSGVSSSPCLISDNTQLILLGSYPGNFATTKNPSQVAIERLQRKSKDEALSKKLLRIYENSLLSYNSGSTTSKMWSQFLSRWYSNSLLWADFQDRHRGAYQNMAQRRIQALTNRAPDFARVLEKCSPARNDDDDWKHISPENTYFLAGQLDKKYSSLGKEWTNLANSMQYKEIPDAGHALLVEASDEVFRIMSSILSERAKAPVAAELPISESKTMETTVPVVVTEFTTHVKPGIFDMECFMIEMSNGKNGNGVKGIGWGEQGKVTNEINQRKGFIISFASDDGQFVGIGEVSPLDGVHPESLNDVKEQLQLIQDAISKSTSLPVMECEKILSLNGSMGTYIDTFIQSLSMRDLQSSNLAASVRSGLEMSLMSLASDAVRLPLPRALMLQSPSISSNILPLNGLVTRGEISSQMQQKKDTNNKSISYSSMKIKVGHSSPVEDARSVINTQSSCSGVCVRADANRAWDEVSAVAFADELISLDDGIRNTLEFVEEPLEKQLNKRGSWDLPFQVNALEQWHERTGIKYALDESLADFVLESKGDNFDLLTGNIRKSLLSANGCAALVLKPTVLGMELSLRLAKFAHEDLGIGAVFTSTFESGVGLAFISFLATVSDSTTEKDIMLYPHGISTFSVLNDDTLSPPFESYVKEDGTVKLSPLGRAIHGLGLDEIRDYSYTIEDVNEIDLALSSSKAQDYQAMSSTSDTGREISIQASLPLPFSDDIACSRFTDLPQQPRWSPWLNSVSYLGNGETEWTLNVRGVDFRWKASSKVLDSPKGIMWDSTSGIKNRGRVEFIKVSDNSCLMKVNMAIMTPRMVALMFKTKGEFVKEFIESKLMKWSVESFRDVVKADLALERGEAELGDALYGAVEGRSNAIEATLSYQNFEDMP